PPRRGALPKSRRVGGAIFAGPGWVTRAPDGTVTICASEHGGAAVAAPGAARAGPVEAGQRWLMFGRKRVSANEPKYAWDFRKLEQFCARTEEVANDVEISTMTA